MFPHRCLLSGTKYEIQPKCMFQILIFLMCTTRRPCDVLHCVLKVSYLLRRNNSLSFLYFSDLSFAIYYTQESTQNSHDVKDIYQIFNNFLNSVICQYVFFIHPHCGNERSKQDMLIIIKTDYVRMQKSGKPLSAIVRCVDESGSLFLPKK